MAHVPEYAIRLDFEQALGTRMVIVNPSKISIRVGSMRKCLIQAPLLTLWFRQAKTCQGKHTELCTVVSV